jgi:MFS family permease
MTRVPGLAVIFATFGVQTLASMAALVLPAIATTAGAALGLDPVLIGIQVSILYATAMLAALTSSAVIRRFGACRTSQVALFLVVAGCCAASLPSIWAVGAGSLLLGLAYGLPNPAASHLLQRFTDVRRRNLIYSFKQAGVPAGGVLAGLLAPTLASTFFWQAPLLLAAVLALGLAALLQPARASWDDDRDASRAAFRLPLNGLTSLLRNASLRFMALTGLLLAAVQLCLVAFLVVALVEELGYGAIAAGAMLAFLQAVSVCGRIGWGWIADRIGDGLAVLIFLCLVLAGSFFAASTFSLTTPSALVIALFIVISSTAVGWNGIFLAEIAQASGPGRVGEITGSAMFFTYLGVVVGPAAFTLIQPVFGGILPAYVVLALASLAACAMLVAARTRLHDGSSLPGR